MSWDNESHEIQCEQWEFFDSPMFCAYLWVRVGRVALFVVFHRKTISPCSEACQIGHWTWGWMLFKVIARAAPAHFGLSSISFISSASGYTGSGNIGRCKYGMEGRDAPCRIFLIAQVHLAKSFPLNLNKLLASCIWDGIDSRVLFTSDTKCSVWYVSSWNNWITII